MDINSLPQLMKRITTEFVNRVINCPWPISSWMLDHLSSQRYPSFLLFFLLSSLFISHPFRHSCFLLPCFYAYSSRSLPMLGFSRPKKMENPLSPNAMNLGPFSMELRTFEFLNYFPILLLLHLPNYPPR
jgi:hypothetical protein